MSLLEELQALVAGSMPPEEEDPLAKMLAASQAQQMQPAGVDPLVADAMSSAPSASPPMGASPGGQNMGHPDVLAYLKELESTGQLTGGDKKPEAPKGMKAMESTVTGEQGGPNAMQRAEAVAAQGQYDIDNALIDVARQRTQADQMAEQASNLRIDASIEHEARQQKEAELAQKQARRRSQQMELASQNDEPINGRRYFDNMSTFSKLTAIVSAGIYGYLGGRGQPPVVELIMQGVQQDVQAQMQDRQANSARRNAIIEQYQNQYQDTALVSKRLEADKLLTLAKETEAKGLDAKTMEAKAAAQDLAGKLKNRVGLLHKEIQQATYEKPVQVTTKFGIPKGVGAGEDMAAKLKKSADLNKSLADAGATPQERVAMLKAAGLPPIEGETMNERKLVDDRLAAEREAVKLNPTEKQKLIEKVDGLASADVGFRELDAVAGMNREQVTGTVTKGGTKDDQLERAIPSKGQQLGDTVLRSLPWKLGEGTANWAASMDPEEVQALRRAAEKITTGMVHAESGAGVSGQELQDARSRLPITNPESLKEASAELWRERKQKYKNLAGQYGKDVIDEMLRARGIDPDRLGARGE